MPTTRPCARCGGTPTKRVLHRVTHSYIYLCESCQKELRTTCSICGALRYKFNCSSFSSHHGQKTICHSCGKKYKLCKECGEIILANVKHNYCHSCFLKHSETCCVCKTRHAKDLMHKLHNTNKFCCQECFKTQGYHCASCSGNFLYSQKPAHEMLHPRPRLICQDCWETQVNPYNYVPKYKFLGTGLPYIGFELEVEPKTNSRSEGVKFIKTAPELKDFVYPMHDGSLNAGFEITSHPFTWNWIKANTNKINYMLKSLQKLGFVSYNTKTCGMHVHMSKTQMSHTHIYKLLKLLYENPAFVLDISQRNKKDLNSWASLNNHNNKIFLYKAKTKGGKNKYTAINLKNPNTIEFRIFKGTLQLESFYKNIEFCLASYEYTKQVAIKNINLKTFYEFLSCNFKTYKHLYTFMMEKELLFKNYTQITNNNIAKPLPLEKRACLENINDDRAMTDIRLAYSERPRTLNEVLRNCPF